MIAGIVLAGGESRRMGHPKPLLKVADETFLERAVRTLEAGGCEDIVVVINGNDELNRISSNAGGRSTPGGGVESEQIESLRAGLRALSTDVEATVVLPVDHPLVKPETVAALIAAFRASSAPIVRVTHRGRHGHPILFGSGVFEGLLQGDLPQGARSVVRAYGNRVEEVEVEDAGVLVDVDTPGEYERHFGESK